MKSLVALVVLLSAVNGYCGEIGDLFASGVFDTEWGDTIEAVEKVHPKGKRKSYSKIDHYIVRDDRTIFGIERKKGSKIWFAFDSEARLNAVSVYFKGSDFGNLLSKLDTMFGEHSVPDTENVAGAVFPTWPEDKNVKISLMYLPKTFGAETIFGIHYTGLDKPKANKKDLGF
jgi:hypothetical protein